jgi:VWFA-related protein
MTRLGLLTVLFAASMFPPAQGQQRPVFRAETAATAVDVSVTDGRRVITDLTTADFVLLDNGVPQAITASSLGQVPFDLTLVVDTSGSLSPQTLDRFKADVTAMAGMLGADDRFRLVTFATRAADAFGWQPGAVEPPLAASASGGATAFYQTLGAVLARRAAPGRRHLVVAMSDGFDNVSLLDERDIQHLARAGDAVLHIVLRRRYMVTSSPSWGWVPYQGPGHTKALRAAAESTGGRLREASLSVSLQDVFRAALDEFRTGYVLWYTPTGVPQPGWHTVDVRVTNRRYTVRARSGYDTGGGR